MTEHCQRCGAEVVNSGSALPLCEDCEDEEERCEECDAELLSVYEEMRGLCSDCIRKEES